MRGAKLFCRPCAVLELSKIIRVCFEVFVGRHDLIGRVDEHAVVVHASAVFLCHPGVRSAGPIAQRPLGIKRTRVERVADAQLGDVRSGDRRDDECVGFGKDDGVAGIEAAAEVFFKQGEDAVHQTPFSATAQKHMHVL